MIDFNPLVSHFLKLIILHCQSVLGLLVSWVLNVLVLGLGVDTHQYILQLIEFMSGSHLVQDVYF